METVALPVSLVERLIVAVERLDARLAHEAAGAAPECDGLLTKQQVAARLGGKCSVRKVERLVRAGKLKKVPGLGRRTVRFTEVDVAALIAGGKQHLPGARRL